MMIGIIASSNFTITPKQISGLLLWYDGQDPDGDNAPPASGTALATFVDKSASSINITQATGSQQMTYQTNVINGRAAMLGSNAAQKYYRSANTITIFNGLNSYCFFSVVRPNSTANNCHLFNAIDASNFGPYFSLKIPSPFAQLQHVVSGGQDFVSTSASTWTSNTNYLLRYTRDGGAASAENITMSTGTTATLNPLAQGALPTSNKTITIPANGGGPSGNTLNGYFGEGCFYNKMPSDVEVRIFENYTKLKWGI